jgi:threonine synthase
MAGWRGVVEEFRDRLDLPAGAEAVSLLEGNTPLLEVPRLSERVGARVLLKLEGMNPTGSFKDRGMAAAMTGAKHSGAAAVLCASTGNTSASAAAYAARAGLTCGVIVPRGNIALGKLAQALAHGADVLSIDGSFDAALRLVRELGESAPVAVVNSVNPDRIEGQKTAAFEIVDVLGEAPDLLCLPVGNAGNITAYWRGFCQQRQATGSQLPRLLGAQAEGAAPIVRGEAVDDPQTVATAIRIGHPASWAGASAAASESSGAIVAVSDEQILDAWRWLARDASVFCEPASAAGVAALLQEGAGGAEVVVCVITGHGLKDPETAMAHAPKVHEIDASTEAVRRALGL